MIQNLMQRAVFGLFAMLLLTAIACNMAQSNAATEIPAHSPQPSLIILESPVVIATNVPTVANQVINGTSSTGVLSVYPALEDPAKPGHFLVQPGSTITIKADNIQNLAQAWFHVPSNGWHGNGWDETLHMPNPGSSIQTQVQVASDLPGVEFPFALEAIALNGDHLFSPQPLWVKIDDSTVFPNMGTISVSPFIPSQEIPDGYAALPGSTITISVDGMQYITSVKFHIPPQQWGKGVVETPLILNPGSHAEIVLVAPMRKASGLVTAIGVGTNGKVIESRAIWLNVENPAPTASIPFTPSN